MTVPTVTSNAIVSNAQPISSCAVNGGRIYYAIKRLLVFYPLFTEALYNLLCLEALRHGTSMRNVISIVRIGVDPDISGQVTGKGWGQSEKTFYVVRDSNFFIDNPSNKTNPIATTIVKRLAPVEYKVAAEEHDSQTNSCINAVKGFFNPTLIFYFEKSAVQTDFQNDERLKGLGLVTQKKISVDHQGIQGIIKQGANANWSSRIKANPTQFVIGIIQMLVSFIFIPLAIPTLCLVGIGHKTGIDRF